MQHLACFVTTFVENSTLLSTFPKNSSSFHLFINIYDWIGVYLSFGLHMSCSNNEMETEKKASEGEMQQECGGKVLKVQLCFEQDQEKESEIGELDEDMRKHRLMQKKWWDLRRSHRQPFAWRIGCSFPKLLQRWGHTKCGGSKSLLPLGLLFTTNTHVKQLQILLHLKNDMQVHLVDFTSQYVLIDLIQPPTFQCPHKWNVYDSVLKVWGAEGYVCRTRSCTDESLSSDRVSSSCTVMSLCFYSESSL